jgi:hypothetical protein
MSKIVYQQVTPDKYEFVVRQADSARELSRLCGVRSDVIEQAVKGTKKLKKNRFVKVIIPD